MIDSELNGLLKEVLPYIDYTPLKEKIKKIIEESTVNEKTDNAISDCSIPA